MNFTREPIIETIITSKEGHRLIIKNSKGLHSEDYFVDAIEVISFGDTCFFRSKEKPQPFLLPVSDYEIIETKDNRIALKTNHMDKPIKLGVSKGHNESKDEEVSNKKKKKKVREKDKIDKIDDNTNGIRKIIPPPSFLIKENLLKHKGAPFMDDVVNKAELEMPLEEAGPVIIDQEEFLIDENRNDSFADAEGFQRGAVTDPEVLEEKKVVKEIDSLEEKK